MPSGDISGWKQVFADNFSGTVPVGSFSDCNHNTDTPQAYCGGLKNYGNYYKNWWAYPSGWDDTAKAGADGNPKAPANSPGGKTEVGGQYHPEDTVSVGDGAMHIKMYRPTSGYQDNHVATVVPRVCMNQQYGRYVERFKVVHADPGFKSAHLFYENNYEIDYPESDSYSDTFSAFTHYSPNDKTTYSTSHSAATQWTDGWHTTAIEWTASSIKFYADGKLIGTTTTNVPHIKMSWILQNESSILGPKFATPGNYAQLDLDWAACYTQS
jgi:beta-glucanase (GH16 family)